MTPTSPPLSDLAFIQIGGPESASRYDLQFHWHPNEPSFVSLVGNYEPFEEVYDLTKSLSAFDITVYYYYIGLE